MNVGDFVRTKDGKIFKWTKYCTTSKEDYNEHTRKLLFDENEIKSSPQIIDLIEVGDLMYVDISPDNCGGIIVPRIAETENELNKYKEKINSGEYILKAIITHKQFKSKAYRVEE